MTQLKFTSFPSFAHYTMTLVKLESLTHTVASTHLLSNMNLWLVCTVLVLTSILCMDWKYRLNLRYLPPGPHGLPILRNIFQIPKFQWFHFTKWKVVYGMSTLGVSPRKLHPKRSIVLFELGRQSHNILKQSQGHCWSLAYAFFILIPSDCLDVIKLRQTWRDRPCFIMAGEILTRGLVIAFTGFSDLYAVGLYHILCSV